MDFMKTRVPWFRWAGERWNAGAADQEDEHHGQVSTQMRKLQRLRQMTLMGLTAGSPPRKEDSA